MSNSRVYFLQGSFAQDWDEEDVHVDELDLLLSSDPSWVDPEPDEHASLMSPLYPYSPPGSQPYGLAGDGVAGHSPGHSSGRFAFGRHQCEPLPQIPEETADILQDAGSLACAAPQENHDIPLPGFAQPYGSARDGFASRPPL